MVRTFGFWIVALLICAHGTQAQDTTDDDGFLGYFNVLNAGIGLNVYQGDLDENPNFNIAKYIASGGPTVFVGLEHYTDRLSLGAELHYNRFEAVTPFVDLYANAVTLDVVGSYPLMIGNQDFLRVYLAAGPTLVKNDWYRNRGGRQRPEYYNSLEESGSVQFMGTFTFGFMIDRTIRLGIRLAPGDMLDSRDDYFSEGTPVDVLTFVSVNHRFKLD